MYPDVRTAWDENTKMATNHLDEFLATINLEVAKKKPDYFRWHVAGDILNQDYVNGMINIARMNLKTQFLAFTKRYDFNYDNRPKNLEIVFSLWPNWGEPNKNFPLAFMQDGTESRITKNTVNCPGNCTHCKTCWHLSELKKNIVFHAH
jgi:hypothetical protein